MSAPRHLNYSAPLAGMGKSQILKFVHKASPIAIYTSGKGSSAAGLTASVVKDPVTRSFVVEVLGKGSNFKSIC